MSRSNQPPTDSEQWSLAIGERYGLRLPEDLVDWFDGGHWQLSVGGQFDQPVAPSSLLQAAPSVLWPGFMQPDFLPLMGNGYGDWLCMRVGPSNDVAEIVHWYHGGGDWIPWGRTFTQAIAFDVLQSQLLGRRQYYANIAAEFDLQCGPGSIPDWATQRLPAEIADAISSPAQTAAQRSQLESQLIEHDISRVAVGCEQLLHALDSPVRQRFTPGLAKELNLDWDSTVVLWMFDNRQIPDSMLEPLSQLLQIDGQPVRGQDWQRAHQVAQQVLKHNDAMVWAHDVCGWVAETEGDFPRAIEHYQASLPRPAFTDQSIRFRTHWIERSHFKFSASRLLALRSHWPASLADNPYLSLYAETDSRPTNLPERVTEYWMRQAERCEHEGRFSDAYDAYYAAGWDLGCDDMSRFATLLSKLAESAAQSGQIARHQVALAHLAALNNFASN